MIRAFVLSLTVATTLQVVLAPQYDLCGDTVPGAYKTGCSSTAVDKAAVFVATSSMYLSLTNKPALEMTTGADFTVWARVYMISDTVHGIGSMGGEAHADAGWALYNTQSYACCHGAVTRQVDVVAWSADSWKTVGTVVLEGADTVEAYFGGSPSGSPTAFDQADVDSNDVLNVGSWKSGGLPLDGKISIFAIWPTTGMSDANMTTLEGVSFCSDITTEGLAAPEICCDFDDDVVTCDGGVTSYTLTNNNGVTLGDGPA